MPQQIDVPGMGVVEFPDGMDDAAITSAIQKNMPGGQMQGPPDERSFFDKATSKVGSFLHNVYENPPPTVAGVRDIIKAAPAAAQELTWGSDPQAAEQAAGTMLGAAALAGTGSRAPQFPARAIEAPAAAAAPSVTREALEAAARLKVPVPHYLATESTLGPRVAASIQHVPFSGQPIVNSANAFMEGLGRAKSDIAPSAAATAESAGEQARTGIANWIKSESQGPVKTRYDRVDELIDPNAHLPLNNTADMARQMIAERANARIPGSSKAVDIVSKAIETPLKDVPPELQAAIAKRNPELLQAAGMNYEGVKTLRSYLGERTPQELVAEGINPREAKRLYGALTNDLRNVVQHAGGDEALAAWQKANAFSRLTSLQRKALGKTVGSAGELSPETVFSKLQNYAGSKSTADISRLRLAKEAMGGDAWNEIGSAMIHRMGVAPDGKFSADRFVTAYGNMAPAAKNTLFSGQQRAALEDLFIVSKFAQERINRLGNPSGTARGLYGGAIGAHMFTEPISAITKLVGGRLVAAAMSRPAVVRAAVDVSRAQMRRNPVATQRALERLYQVAVREGLIRASQQ